MPSPLLLAVTGHPVLHSRSPQIMNAALQTHHLPGTYLRLAAASAGEALDLVKTLGIRGLNVTAPYKPDMLALADVVDPLAQKIGGANTIVNDDGKISAFNSDHFGVVRSLEERGISLAERPIVVLGAGGASRGAVCGLVHAGARVTIINRTFAKARELAAAFDCAAAPLEDLEQHVRQADGIVSILSPHVQVLNPEWLRSGQFLFEANYKGASLPEQAARRGCQVITGLDWLLNQAIPAFSAFTGTDCTRDDLAGGLSAPPLDINRPIALIGFMGSGKTTSGRRLAKAIGRQWIDIDHLIEQREGNSISKIFKEKGEKEFRKLERRALDDLSDSRNLVISCGGGIIESAENRKLLQERTLCVWLVAGLESTLNRCTGNDDRPLLNVPDPRARMRELFAHRRMLYAEAAHLVVSTEHPDSYAATDKIYEELRLTFNR